MQKLSVITYVTLILSVFVLSALLIGNLLDKGGDLFNSLSTTENTEIAADTNTTIASTTNDSITYVIDQPAEDAAYSTETSTEPPAPIDSTVSEESPVTKNKVKDESPEH